MLHRCVAQSARRTIMSKMDSVVHFEMPYDDRERMAKFYRDAFGWQTRMLGEEMGNYVLATTTESDESGPKRPGAINGGFYKRKSNWPAQHPSFIIAVDDIQAAMRKVAEAGGKVSFVDTENNRASREEQHTGSWKVSAVPEPATVPRSASGAALEERRKQLDKVLALRSHAAPRC